MDLSLSRQGDLSGNMAELFTTSLLGNANLQGYWRFESNFTDSGPNGYTLTNNSTVSVSGRYGLAIQSNGVGVDATSTGANLEITGSQSWSCWFNSTGTGDFDILLKDGTGARLLGLRSTKIQFLMNGLTTNTSVNSAANFSASTWNHIVGVYDSSNTSLTVYLNNVATTVTASGSSTACTLSFSVGPKGAGTGSNTVSIDDVAVFNRALTASEVNILFSDSLGSYLGKYIGA